MQHQSLDSFYTLSPDQITGYRRDGQILIKGLASREEIAGLRPGIQAAVQHVQTTRDAQGRLKDYGRYFLQVTNVWRLNEHAQRFVFAQRFARVAAELMGVEGVRLYHDQALFKPAGGKGTPWHQDQVYWPLDTRHTITMWMPLVDLTKDMGTMMFANGSHRDGSLSTIAISDESDRHFEALVKEKGFPVVSYELNAGDATFHSGWTAHAAFPNNGAEQREIMTIIYYADGTRVAEPDNQYRLVDLQAFHPGCKPGDLALSELNPLLYSASSPLRE